MDDRHESFVSQRFLNSVTLPLATGCNARCCESTSFIPSLPNKVRHGLPVMSCEPDFAGSRARRYAASFSRALCAGRRTTAAAPRARNSAKSLLNPALTMFFPCRSSMGSALTSIWPRFGSMKQNTPVQTLQPLRQRLRDMARGTARYWFSRLAQPGNTRSQ